MGIDIQGAQFLGHGRRHGVRYKRLAMLGRQHFMVSPEQLTRWLEKDPDMGFSSEQRQVLLSACGQYAEAFFGVMGAEETVSFDASPFEGATVVHDFNCPVPSGFHAAFDTVLDSGSLEHIFNFPVAIGNLLTMVKPGGHLVLITPANNLCGHGFYQFSPELFYRVLDEANGFRVKRMLVSESFPDAYWYHVPNPAEMGRRVSFENRYWTYLYIIAERVEAKGIFHKTPQQSDYDALWQAHAKGDAAAGQMRVKGESTPGSRWQLRMARWKRSLKHRMLKFTSFRGKERELILKLAVFPRADGP